MALNSLPDGTRLRATALAPNGRFVIVEPLGGGGFGRTYRALDMHERIGASWRTVVIKEFGIDEFCEREASSLEIVLAPHRDHEVTERRARTVASWRARFLAEARHLHGLHSSFVPAVYDLWDGENGTAYYAMEDAGNHTLSGPADDDFVAMSWTQLRPIAHDLLRALDDIHSAGIVVHGDIKPSNVMIAADGRLRLIDFGTARSSAELRKTVTSRAFTRGYAAPELQSDTGDSPGPWSDLYGWAMLVLSLAGAQPTRDGSPLDAQTRAVVQESGGADAYDTIATNANVVARVPEPAWRDALAHCLRLDPCERPDTARDVLNVVEATRVVRPAPEPPQRQSTPVPIAAAKTQPTPAARLKSGTIVDDGPIAARGSGAIPGVANRHGADDGRASSLRPGGTVVDDTSTAQFATARRSRSKAPALLLGGAAALLLAVGVFALSGDRAPATPAAQEAETEAARPAAPSAIPAAVVEAAGANAPTALHADEAHDSGNEGSSHVPPAAPSPSPAPTGAVEQVRQGEYVFDDDTDEGPINRRDAGTTPSSSIGTPISVPPSDPPAARDPSPSERDAGQADTRVATPPSPPVRRCGDGRCDSNETCSSCASDCGCARSQQCTSGRCVSRARCGDGVCNSGESCSSCASDCACAAGSVCRGSSCITRSACLAQCEGVGASEYGACRRACGQ